MEKLHNKPDFPLLDIYKDDYFILINSNEELLRCRASVFFTQHKHKSFCFDAEGNKWEYILEPVYYKATTLNKVLSYIVFFNPFIDVLPVFSQVGNYELDELKSTLKKCVDVDDDVITQFVEGDVIKTAIDKASGFNEMLAVFEKYVFNPDEEEIWKEL